MTDAALAGSRAKVSSRWFYAWMAMTCAAIAVLGFVPTYFIPLATGKLRLEPVIHLHGMVTFGWMTLFCVQTWLVAKGGTLAHRTWGMLGIALITAMACLVTTVVSLRIAETAGPAIPPDFHLALKKFEWVPFSGILTVVPLFVLAIASIKKPEFHKRYMLLTSISMLPAPIARWFLVFLAPPPDPNAPVILLPNGAPAPSVPPVDVALAPALLADLLIIVAMVYDWRTRGKIHPVYIWGGLAVVLSHMTYGPIASSSLWLDFADWLGKLAG